MSSDCSSPGDTCDLRFDESFEDDILRRHSIPVSSLSPETLRMFRSANLSDTISDGSGTPSEVTSRCNSIKDPQRKMRPLSPISKPRPSELLISASLAQAAMNSPKPSYRFGSCGRLHEASSPAPTPEGADANISPEKSLATSKGKSGMRSILRKLSRGEAKDETPQEAGSDHHKRGSKPRRKTILRKIKTSFRKRSQSVA
eukprot:Rmarinus@m.19374